MLRPTELEGRNLLGEAQRIAARAASASTRRQYASIFRAFGDWLAAELGRPPVVGDLDADVLGAYGRHLATAGGRGGRPAAPATARAYLSMVRALARDLGCEDQVDGVRISRHEPGPPETLTDTDYANLLRVPDRRLAHPHALRAYWATQCLEAGVPVHAVSARLGHVDLRTTARYAAARPEQIDDIADVLDRRHQVCPPRRWGGVADQEMSACEVTTRVIGHGSPLIPEISSARRDPRCARRGRRATHGACRLSATRGSIRQCAYAPLNREGAHLPLTQTQLAIAVADRAEIPRAEAKRVLGALEEIVLEELSNAQKVRVVGLVQLTVRVKPAQKKRQGRNPATGEEITIAAKPASVDLRARPLAKAKAALPSVQKARRRLSAA